MNISTTNDDTKTMSNANTQSNRIEDSPFAPSTQELERLLFAIESSLQINRRFQFFLWAQGVLQSFLPHQTLICVSGNLDSGQFQFDSFASDLVAQGDDPEADASTRTLILAAVESWIQGDRAVLSRGVDSAEGGVNDALQNAILELGLGNIIAHGTREFSNQASFFIFGRMARKAGKRSISLIESLMPILHFALHRYNKNEAVQTANSHGSVPVLSERELQILHSVCGGKTNGEIGVDLSISPLTVKNHMQRILRKLGVNNRAQAVARSIALGLFDKRRHQ